ncbi:MAG TPA: two-component regulator propeller domain-containing protein [Puia sp.]|nr:two-component regulator propeller domain-containing protein [Puia sp.]
MPRKGLLRYCLYPFLLLLGAVKTEAQFPGYYVQHFNSDNGMQNTVKGMQLGNDGFLWIATESGLVRYDGTRFKLIDHEGSGLPLNRLTGIGLTKTGMLYVQWANGTYYYIAPGNKLIETTGKALFSGDNRFRTDPRLPARLQLACREKFNRHLIAAWAIPEIKTPYLSTCVAGNSGFYYYLNKDQELVVTDTALTHFSRFGLNRTQYVISGRPEDRVEVSLMQRGNDVYLRRAETIYQLEFFPGAENFILDPIAYVGNIPGIIAFVPLPAYQGFVVGTLTDGIYFFQKQLFTTEVAEPGGTNIFYAQAPFGKDGVLTHLGVVSPGGFTPLHENFDYRFILRAKDGSYYLYAKRGDLCQLDSNLHFIRNLWRTPNRIFFIKELSDSSRWISAESYFLGRLGNDSIQWFDRPSGLPPGFNVSDFLEDGPGRFWIAGPKGLAKIEVTDKVRVLAHQLDNVYIRNLYKDSLGTIWIGTYGNGFYAWYKNRLIKLPLDPDNWLAYAHTFMEDHSGHFWISTNHGLFELSRADLYRYLDDPGNSPYYYYFDRRAGFLTNEFNGGCSPAGIILGNGKFSLPSLNGLVQFYPDSVKPAFPTSDIFIDGIMADTTSIDVTANKITIPPHTGRLRINISSPYFGNPYNQLIQYRDELSGNWYNVNNDGVIELNNLKSGEHAIQFRKLTGFGLNNVKTKELRFQVQPRFVETPLFRLIIVFLITSLLYLIYKLRVRWLTQQKKHLEKEVFEKTKEQQKLIEYLETVVAELEESKTDLQKNLLFKQTLAMIITHDLQSPLRFLSDAIQRMHQYNKTTDADAAELSAEIAKSSTSIYRFVEEFSLWIKKANIQGQVNRQNFNIVKLLHELTSFFEELRKSQDNSILLEAPAAVNIYSDYQLLKIILRNIIDNANKNTEHGLITLCVSVNGPIASLSVKDTGSGMKPEILQKIQKRISDPSSFNYGQEIEILGFGYRFVTDFCKLLNIVLHIESRPGEGTLVTLSNLKIAEGTTNS